MPLDDELIEKLEDLSCLTLSGDEKGRLKEELPDFLESLAKLKDLDAGGREECISPLDNFNVFREDEAAASFDRRLILQNAAHKTDEMIIAPKTVD